MASFTQLLYDKMPLWLQNLAISAYGYKWNKRRFGGIYKKELKKYKQRESFSFDDWNKYQTDQLRQLLVHAFNEVPYYTSLFNAHKITLEQLMGFSLSHLNQIPFLEKNTLREEGKLTLLAKNTESKGEFYASSGSTGTPTQILFSAAMHQRWSAAFEARIRNWAGLSIQNARGMIGGRRVVKDASSTGPYYRYNSVEKQVYFSAYHISAINAPNYIEGMEKHNIQYMTGYAMSNFFLARFIKASNLQAPKLTAVITSSEKTDT
jgi:phenylacetate-CoA ligase